MAIGAATLAGVLDGDLYVLNGTVALANNCTINGDIYADGNVTSNSASWHINARPSSESTGSITTNGYVTFSSNGGTSVAGAITAEGDITLSDNGTDTGTVGGGLTSNHNISVGSSWTTGTQTPNFPTDPVFNPTLEWLRAATQWIDLPASASWGTRQTGVCTMTPAQLVTLMATAGGPLVIDLTPCPNNAAPFTGAKLALSISNTTIQRDVVVLSPAGKKLEVALGRDGRWERPSVVPRPRRHGRTTTCRPAATATPRTSSTSADRLPLICE